MKRIISTLIIFTFLLTAAGGINQRYAKAAEDDKSLSANTNETAETKDSVDLKSFSEELAKEITAGNFDKLYDTFSPAVKAQITKDALKQGWDNSTASLGKFIKIYSSTMQTKAPYRVVEVILQYEYNGIKISFTYNSLNLLDGIFFSYSPIPSDLEDNDYFKEQKIVIGKGNYAVSGILTLPKKVKKPPVVILVPGSGTHDADETVGANKPFRDIAYGLAKKGIASIRYNERLLEHPELATANLTIYDDCLGDACEAVKFAQSCDKIDTKRIIVIGHSLGGMMAPKIAADNKKVAGIICLAGSPRNLADISADQQVDAVNQAKGITKEQKAQALAEIKKITKQIKSLKAGDTNAINGVPASYWYSLNQINTSKLVKKLNIPILIGQGSADFQVYKDKDYAAWKTILKGKKNVTFHLYKNLNHLFMTSNGKSDVTEYNTKGTVDQKVINDMAVWINKVGK